MEFLVELYVARGDDAAASSDARLASGAAADLFDRDSDVRGVRTIVVPEDETCFLLVEAPGQQAVQRALERAGLRCEHISAATST
jgi:ribosomal protein S11